MTKQREFTGRHALMVFGGAFAVIIAVNIALAVSAVRTFPGLEVKNSYVASQNFNERKVQQEGLGWEIVAEAYDGNVYLAVTDEAGNPVEVETLEAIVGRATHVQDDLHPEFRFDGSRYVAPADLGKGNWNIRMTATARDGTTFSQRVVLHIKD